MLQVHTSCCSSQTRVVWLFPLALFSSIETFTVNIICLPWFHVVQLSSHIKHLMHLMPEYNSWNVTKLHLQSQQIVFMNPIMMQCVHSPLTIKFIIAFLLMSGHCWSIRHLEYEQQNLFHQGSGGQTEGEAESRRLHNRQMGELKYVLLYLCLTRPVLAGWCRNTISV